MAERTATRTLNRPTATNATNAKIHRPDCRDRDAPPDRRIIMLGSKRSTTSRERHALNRGKESRASNHDEILREIQSLRDTIIPSVSTGSPSYTDVARFAPDEKDEIRH
ncbi:hypothetical protein N7481_001516 [Penicillium waksmanii]|uniref:uncharacterized protein n=1 Tax=Penicillium waksmanii TaxID=69791 RepID=UPI0025484326|nr:uncharacterized protein N7481_001516 [Penicillium waksmanii]KAJ6001107.1 hypothetical protein N7481_001516 [Penicillium waksmanii]